MAGPRRTTVWDWLITAGVLALASAPAVPLAAMALTSSSGQPVWTQSFAHTVGTSLLLGFGVAVTSQAVVRELVRLRSELGFALVLVTHDSQEVRQACDSLAVLQSGRIAEQGRLSDVAADPQTVLAKTANAEPSSASQ